jgi:trehalose 6-phosphate phosphatase
VPFRAVPGKFVINALPARAPSRGDVLLELREKTGQDTALYVGDDVSDEEVFHLDQPGRLLCVRIGASATSAAPYFLKNQLEVDRLLSALVAFRTRKNS